MKKRFDVREYMGVIAFAGVFLVFALLAGKPMISLYNLRNVVDQTMQIIIGGLGVIFIIAMGSVDLSIGGLAAVAASTGCLLSEQYGDWIMIPSTLLVGVIVGFINGVIISKMKVSSFMCTLAMLISLKGVLSLFLASKAIYAPQIMKNLNEFPIRLGFMILLIAIMGYVFEFTRLGRYSKAMGENEVAAKTIGINVDRTRIAAFTLTGLMAGFVGLYQISKLGGASATMGSFMEMRIMMAIFLGGVLVTGGFRTKIYKMIIGAFTISIVVNGLNMVDIDTNYSEAVHGILLMAILFITIFFYNRNPKTKKISNQQ